MRIPVFCYPAFGLFISLAGCNHTISFNNNILYTPNPLQRAGVLNDPSLQGCLNQVLEGGGTTDHAAVTLLACPDAAISTLEGIEALTALEQLEVSNNLITDLSPLTRLRNLRVLSIRNNLLGDIRLLDTLPTLRFISLQGNDRIPCRQLDTLQQRLGNTLGRPAACIN